MAKLIERESVDRQFGFSGTNAIVEIDDCHRLLVCDGFGGIDSLEGGTVRWRHGAVYGLQPSDTFESLRAGEWNEHETLWDAVIHGHDGLRPVLDADPEEVAKSAGIA